MHAYDIKDIRRLFGLPPSAVRSLARAGNINPVRRKGKLHYTFQDLVVLRTAGALRAAKIAPRRINRTLKELRLSWPAQLMLNQVSLTALGNRIVIRENGTVRESESGQYALALEIVEEKGELHVIARRDDAAPARADASESAALANEIFERALALDDHAPLQARQSYEACLEADHDHLEARINLGRLLHEDGRLAEAEKIYRGTNHREPLLTFNLAVLLEDMGRESDAIKAYRETLAMDPQFADAHFNIARLYERANDARASLRHLLAYRRMIGKA